MKSYRALTVVLFALGVCSGIGFFSLVVIGLIVDRASYLADSIALLLPGAIFLSAGAWLVNRQRQIAAAVDALGDAAVEGRAPGPYDSAGRARLPGAPAGWQLVRANRGPLVGYLLVVILTTSALWIAVMSADWLAVPLAVVGGLGLAVLIFWAALVPTIYLKPADLAEISRADRTSQVWASATSAGLKAYANRKSSVEPEPRIRLKLGGYMALTATSLQFWQRNHAQLEVVFQIPLESIVTVELSSVSWSFVLQKGVLLTVANEHGGTSDIPVLPSNVTRARYGKASQELFQALEGLKVRRPPAATD